MAGDPGRPYGSIANITVNVLEPGQLAEINEASYGEYLYGGGEGRFVMDQQGNFTVAKWR